MDTSPLGMDFPRFRGGAASVGQTRAPGAAYARTPGAVADLVLARGGDLPAMESPYYAPSQKSIIFVSAREGGVRPRGDRGGAANPGDPRGRHPVRIRQSSGAVIHTQLR